VVVKEDPEEIVNFSSFEKSEFSLLKNGRKNILGQLSVLCGTTSFIKSED
jgi:hypothetical protein